MLFGINADGAIIGRAYTPSGAFAFARRADGRVTQLSVDGTSELFAYSINNQGAIAGFFGWPYDGFVRDGSGNVTTVSAPHAERTMIYRLNEHGDAVGVAYPEPGNWIGHGFLMR
jgi:hypothetical protein